MKYAAIFIGGTYGSRRATTKDENGPRHLWFGFNAIGSYFHRSEGGPENATGALAVHDSPAAAVVVSLGAGGPGIGRRAARPPRTKNRGIRRARDDARRGAPPCAPRLGRYRADQGEMPRCATRELDSRPNSGFTLRATAFANGH